MEGPGQWAYEFLLLLKDNTKYQILLTQDFARFTFIAYFLVSLPIDIIIEYFYLLLLLTKYTTALIAFLNDEFSTFNIFLASKILNSSFEKCKLKQ